MSDDSLLSILREPGTAIAYAMTLRLRAEFPGSYVLETEEPLFDASSFLAAHDRSAPPRDEPAPQIVSGFGPPVMFLHPLDPRAASRKLDGSTYRDTEIARRKFEWEQHELELATLSWMGAHMPRRRHYLIAPDRNSAEAFFERVCSYHAEVRDEILVFANGCWRKSRLLYEAVRESSFDDLILRGDLSQRIRDDFTRFLASRADYARHRIPYKRGALFLGPPGNGKTLCIKALIGVLDIPCLYVQSFSVQHATPQQSIAEVFARSRRTAPCVLVLEDLDTLIDGQNLSFFLNELDGFAGNDGLITIASTNHPERLDPAILQRPSRFDRKYHFELPGPDERTRYVERWNGELTTELRLPEDALPRITEATEGFSFAYLKELFVSSLMRWSAEQKRGFAAVVLEETEVLAEQMKSLQARDPVKAAYVDDDPIY